MAEAIALARDNLRSGRGGPFAALVVRGGEVIARAANLVTARADPTAHAEVLAIREACRRLGSHSLAGCDLYATGEPCPMCLGAIYWARLDRVFYSASRHDAADAGFDDRHIYEEIAVPPAERRIPLLPALPTEGRAVLREWTMTPGRRVY